jgi:hypothetical protein
MSRRMAARDGVMVNRMVNRRNYVFSGETLIILYGQGYLEMIAEDYLMRMIEGNAGSLERVNSNLRQSRV